MIKNAIAYITRKRNRTLIIFIILTIVLSCLYSCLTIMKSSNEIEKALYESSNSSISITRKDGNYFNVNEFKDIVDSCDICPNFKKYKAKIITGQSGLMTNEFLLWKELVNTHYPKLNLVATPLKTKNQYTLEITRID